MTTVRSSHGGSLGCFRISGGRAEVSRESERERGRGGRVPRRKRLRKKGASSTSSSSGSSPVAKISRGRKEKPRAMCCRCQRRRAPKRTNPVSLPTNERTSQPARSPAEDQPSDGRPRLEIRFAQMPAICWCQETASRSTAVAVAPKGNIRASELPNVATKERKEQKTTLESREPRGVEKASYRLAEKADSRLLGDQTTVSTFGRTTTTNTNQKSPPGAFWR